jgi:signal peptidase
MKRIALAVGNLLLWIGAILGVLTLTISALSLTGIVKPLVVSTGSMAPTFDAGAFILSVEKPAEEAKEGMIATVPREDGVLVTHRISEIETKDGSSVTFRMKGDANDSEDENPYTVEAFGTPLVIIPGVGTFVAAINNFKFIIIAGIAAVVLMAVIWFPSKKTKEEPEEAKTP